MVKLKINKDVGFLTMYLFLLLIAYVFPYTLVLSKAGLDEPEIAIILNFFVRLMYGGFLGLPAVYFLNKIWKQDDKYGNNIGIFSKERTIFRRFTYPQIALFFTIILGIILFSANLINTGTLTGLRVLPQQFTPTDSLAFSTLLTPTAENLFFGVVIGIMLMTLRFFAVKTNMGKGEFLAWSFLVGIFGGAGFGVLWHISAYSGSTINLLVVAGFWGIMGGLALLTGFFLVPLILHQLNNFFIDFSRLFSSTVVQGTTIGVIVMLIGLYLWLYRGRLLPFGGTNEITV